MLADNSNTQQPQDRSSHYYANDFQDACFLERNPFHYPLYSTSNFQDPVQDPSWPCDPVTGNRCLYGEEQYGCQDPPRDPFAECYAPSHFLNDDQAHLVAGTDDGRAAVLAQMEEEQRNFSLLFGTVLACMGSQGPVHIMGLDFVATSLPTVATEPAAISDELFVFSCPPSPEPQPVELPSTIPIISPLTAATSAPLSTTHSPTSTFPTVPTAPSGSSNTTHSPTSGSSNTTYSSTSTLPTVSTPTSGSSNTTYSSTSTLPTVPTVTKGSSSAAYSSTTGPMHQAHYANALFSESGPSTVGIIDNDENSDPGSAFGGASTLRRRRGRGVRSNGISKSKPKPGDFLPGRVTAPKKRHPCPHASCSQVCASPGDLKRHLESKPHKAPSYRCTGCQSWYTRIDALKRHRPNGKCPRPTQKEGGK